MFTGSRYIHIDDHTHCHEITALPGCYLLVILGEPLCENHKEKILQRVAKGLLSWNTEETQCDLKHLEQVCDNLKTSQKSSGKTELLLQHSTDKLAVEVLFNPQIFTLKQCLRNLLLSPTGHKHVIHAGYSFTVSGSWILQDGIFRFHDFVDELSDPGVTKVLSLYPPGCSLKMHLHCSPTGDWVTNNLENQAFSHFMHLSLNPPDSPNGVPGASSLLEFIEGSLETLEGEEKLEPSPLIGNIRFERPTMYIFPSGQGDCSLFGVTGFTMLIDGGFTRFPCFWKFVRHIERLDSIMITRINESNLWGILSLLRGKQESSLYLKIGYVFCNIVDKSINSSEEGVNSENGGVASIQSNPNDLTISIIEVGNEIASRLKRIGCNPHQCLRDPTPTQLTLYHKVGHGTLEMFILSPPRDSRLLKDFLAHWSSNKDSLPVVRTRSACKNGGQSGQDIAIPISDVMSICCLLIWKPSNPNDRITRILFPGSAPQSQIMEGLASLKDLDLLQKRVCTASSLKQSKSKSTVKSTVRISETSSSTATQKLSTRYRSVSPSMRKTRVPYAKQSSTEVGDKGGDSSESQSSPVKRKLIPATNHQTETSRVTRVSTRESVKKTAHEEKKSAKNVTEKKAKTRTSSTTRSTTNKATSKPSSEPTSEANETPKARPITSKQVRARINSRRVSDKTTSENDNDTKKEIQSCTVTAENGDSDFSDKKRETVEVCSEDDHRDSGKGSEDASPKKLPFLDHLRDEVEPDSLESYEIYGNVEISKDSLEHSEDEVVTGDSRSTSQLDHMISREDDDEDMKSRSSPIQEDSNLQSAMVSSLSSNMSEMTIISGDKNDDSASDLEVASLTSRINNNQMSRSIEISHVEGSRRKSTDSNGSFRTLEAEIKAACMEEDRQSIGSSSRKSSILSDADKRRDSIVKENIFASETTSHGKQEIDKSTASERRRSSIIAGDDAYRRASISKEGDKLERKLSKSNEYQIEQEIEDSKVDSLEFKEESIERFSETLTQNEMQISSEKKKDSSGSLEDKLPKGSIEEGESLRKDSVRLSIDKSMEEKKIEESTIKSENETSGQNDIEPIVPESKDNVNEAEVISKETDIDSKEILSTEKEKLLIDSSKSHSDVSSELLSQSRSETSLDIESTKQTVDDKNKMVQSADQSLTHGSDDRETMESVTDSQQSVIASAESTSESEKKRQEEEQLTIKTGETLRKDSITSESKAESQVCDENVGAYKINEEQQNLNAESASSIETSKQSQVITSEESDRKMSGGILSSIETENKDLDDKLDTTVGDYIKQDSFASRKESIKTSDTFSSSEPASDKTKPESRKSSLALDETKQQITSTPDEYSNIDGDSRQFQHSFTSQDTEIKGSSQTVSSDKIIETKEASLKRESVSDVFDLESEKDTKNIEIGFDEAAKTESSLGQINRKESVQLDKDRSSISGDSRKQSLTSEARKSIDSPLSPIDRKESFTHEESQIGRKDSVQFDFDKSKSVDSRRSTQTEIQYNTMASMESDAKISGQTSSSIQDERKESVQLDQVRSSISDDSRKQSLSSETIKSNESLLNQSDRKGSVQLEDKISEGATNDDRSSSSQITRKDSVQSDFDQRQSLDSRRSTETEIQYNAMETDSKISGQTSTSIQDERKESIQMDKERSSISGDSRRSTETDIQYKTITSVEKDSKVSTETSSSSQITRKESVQLDKDRSSISGDSRRQSLTSEARKSIDSDEIKRRESISQQEDKVFTDSVPASPLTKHQDKSDEIIQSNAKHEDSSIGVVETTENIESKNTQQSNLLEKVPFETENLHLSKSESILSDDKKGGDDQKSHDIPSQLSSTISSVSSNTKSDEQTIVDKSEFEDTTSAINYDIKSNDEAENKSITEHRRKPSIDMTSNKLSTITSTTDSSSTESNATNTTSIIDQHSTSDSVDSESFSMQDTNKQTAGQKSIEVTSSQAEAKELEISKEILTISKDDSTSTSKTSITETTSITATNTIQSDAEKSESSSSIVQPESAESYSKSIPELQEKSMVQSSESEITESKSSDSVKPIQTETKPSEDNIKLEEQIGKSEEPGVDTKSRKESLKESVEAQKVSLQSSDAPCKSNEEDIIQEEILRKSSVDIIAQQNSENGEKSKGTDSKRSSIDVEIQKANYSIGSNSIEQKSIHEEESKSALLATDQITQKSESKVEESKSKESTETISSETEKGSLIQSQESSTFDKLQSSIVQQTTNDSESREQAESSIQATSFSTESSPKGDQQTSFTMDLSSTADESSKIIASSVDDKAKQSTSEVSNGLAEKRDSTTSASVEASDNLQQSQIVSGQATQLSNELSEKIIVDSKDNILQSSDSVSETKQLKDLDEKRRSVSKTDDERRTSLATDSATIREIFTTSDSDGSISYSVGGSIVTTSVSKPDIEQETKLETSSELSKETKDISSQSANARTQFEERKSSIVSSTKELEIVESSSTETVVSTNVVDSKLVGSNLETTSGAKDVTSSGITKLYLGQVSGFESCEDSESHEAEEHIQSPKNIGMNNNLISSDLKETSDDLASDLEVASLTSKMDGSSKMTEESRKEYESKVSLENECVEQLSSENYSSDTREQYSVKDSNGKLHTTEGDDIKQDSFKLRKESIKTSETFPSSEPASDGKKPESRKSSMASDETKQQTTSKSTADEYSNIDGDSRQFQHSFTSQDTEIKSSPQTVSSVSDVFNLESEKDTKNIEIGFDEAVKTESSFGQINRKESVQLDKERSSISGDSRKQSLTSEARKSIDSPLSPIDRKESFAHEESKIGRKDSVQSDFDKSKSGDSRRSTVTEIQYNTVTSMESDSKTSGQTPSSTQITRKESVQLDKERSSISGDSRKQSLTSEARKSIDSNVSKRRESISQQEDQVFTDSVPASPLTKHQDKNEIIQSDKERSSISGDHHGSTETDIHYKTITSVESDTKISTESSPSSQITRKESVQIDKDRSSISGDSRKQKKGSVQLKDTISEGASDRDSLPSSQITRKDSVQSDFDQRQSLDSRRSTETEVHYNTATSMEIDSKTSGQTSSSIELERKDSVQMDEERSSLSGDSRRSTEIHYNTVTSMESDAKFFEDSSSPAQSTRKDSVHLDKDTSSISDDKRKQSLTSESIEYLFSQLERRQSEQLKDAKSESEKHGDSSVSFQTSQTIRKDSVQFDLDKSNVSGDSRRSTETEIQYKATNELEKGTASFGDSSSSQITRKDSVQTDKERSSISADSRRSTETDIQYKTVESDSKVSTETSASSQITRKDSVQSDRERSSISDYPRKQSLSSATRKSIDSDEIKRRESISQQEDKVFTDSVPASPLTKHQDKSDEIIQSNAKHEDSSIGVVETTENIESKNTQQSNLLEKVPFDAENLNLSKSESTLSDDKKSHDISGQLSSTISSASSNEKSDEQTKVTMSESMRKYSQSESDNKFYTTSAIKSNDETENKSITEHRRKPSIDMTANKLTTTTDSSSTESKTTITTEQINFGANMIGSSYLGSDARTSFIETNIQKEVVDETKAIVAEIDDAARKSMLVDKSISLDSIDSTDSIKQSTGDKVTNKSTTSGNTLVQSGDSFAQQTSELKRESFSKIEANNQLYSTLTESFDDIQVDLQSTKSSNLTSSNFSDAKFLNKSESLSSENATHSTKFDTVMSIDEETYFYLEDSDSLAQDGHSMASISSDKRVTKEGENNKITLSETSASHSSTTQKHEDLTSSTPETKLFKLCEFSSFSEAEQPAKTIETSQKSQMETKDSKLTDSSHESRVEKDGNKISGNLVSDSVQEKMIIKSSDESGSTVMIEERSSIDYKPFTSFSESSFGSSSASSRTNQTKGNSENLMSLKEEMDKSRSSSEESKLKTSDEALSGKILSSSVYSGASHYTEEEQFESGYAPFAKCVGIKKIPSQPEPDSWTNVVSTTKSFTVESSDQLEGEDRHHTKQYEVDEGVEEKMKSPTLSNQSSAKLVSPTLSPLPGQSFDKLSRDIVDKGVSLRSMAATELASSIVHLETSVSKVTTNLNLPEVISEEAGSKGEESPDLSSPKQSTSDFIAKVETAPGAGTLATTFPTAGEMPSVHLRRSAQMAGQVLYEVPDEEDNVESPLSEKKPVGLARGTTSSVEFPEVLHISEETTPSTPSETQSPRDAKSLTQTTTVTTTSMDITSPEDSKSGLCCFPRSIELDGIKKGKEEKVTSSTSETTTRVVTQSQSLTEEQKKEKEATLKEWGTPLGLPKPTDANDSKGARSASKSRAISSDRTGASRSYSSRRSGSSSDIKPIYLDLAYIPHHGDRHYCNADYFKRIRARYYVLSSVNPSKEVLDALIEGKKSWEDKAAEVTLIPSHETEALCLWMATNQQTLEDLNIDVAPSASRCSVILQDQESSCSAYRVEF
uniref:Microtubule-associated protein futsch n=1 Tax=Tetranychus urticae TaxID=32264 RepID=T1K168_TETUR